MSLEDVLGQDKALTRLRSYLASGKLPPAFLFSGPAGVGKTLAAVQFAKALNCGEEKEDCCDECRSCESADRGIDPDFHWVNAKYQATLLDEEEAKQRSIKIETVRHLIRDLEMRSMEGRWKVAVLENAQTLVSAAANAMLKTLEEPPPRTLWILVTHRPWELLMTIRSRCQRVPFMPLPEALIVKLVEKNGFSKSEAAAAAPLAEGSVGRALKLLETPLPSPSEWLHDPMAPIRMSEKLPKELFRQRPLVAEHLLRMAWHVRESRGTEGFSVPAVRKMLRELAELRRSLDSMADPRLVLELAAIRLQQLEAAVPRKP